MVHLTERVLSFAPHGIIHAHDLNIVLPNRSHDSRFALIKRALASGELQRLRRGLYCLAPQFRRQAPDTHLLAQLLCGPSYISQESALSYHRWIREPVDTVTSVTSQKANQFETPLGRFTFARIPQTILYEQVDRLETCDRGIAFIAQPLKALVDYVYVNKTNWAGLDPVIATLHIAPDQLARVTSSDLATLTANYQSKRIKRFLAGLKRDLGR